MLTQRAALLGFVALCFYLIAVANQLPSFYYALSWLSMGMLAACLGLALLSLVGLECRLRVTRSRAAASLQEGEGGGAQVALAISNAGTLNKTNVILELRLLDANNQLQKLRFLFEAVPSGAAIDAIVPLSGLKRGKYHLQEAHLMGSDVLGLFRTQKKVTEIEESGREIVIGPAVLSGESHSEVGGSGSLLGNRRAFQSRHGEELRGTRPYSPGDDLRHVHWKSSARAGELVVKEFEQTGQSSVLVVWDGAAQTTWGDRDFDSTEWSLMLSASLCQMFLSGGTPCNFARIDASPLLVEARALAGGELPVEFTDALSGASANREIPLESAFHLLPRLNGRLTSSTIFVSASLSGDLVRAVRGFRTHGARVQVVLIDGAALAERARDRRFRARGGRFSAPKIPVQRDGNNSVALTSANFELQCRRLRESGAEIVRVVAAPDQSAEATLRAALRTVFEAPGLSGFAP
ncbi:putative conserved protein, DUF58 family, contains vWF domain [Abditibacterium utsteinense]|uniref:Putative conserved protein, DUF58 family, contains vWF domain n=1 Tax=Abditibacterium utsteinense TaxID=1960156 RepID=A0A2S8SXC8_9BACT|nr:DUF58 domain-containing protein [Abditibacterium utsteinense]PQV65461.1 putative conserved protein, DUF58 family, contains vWF domain [Abditibacterium utsteinense]